MCASLMRVDVVGKRVDQLCIAVVPLQRNFGEDTVLVTLHEDWLLVHRSFVLVQVRDERDDAAFVMELMTLGVALIVERDDDAAVEERELAKTLRQCVEAEDDCLE